ncbi:MAG: alpha/beta hydrolase [Bacteroidaceae bacterium]|nr:alpha/beta hydrolase [Bacteroidaceae bacterium]
MKINRLTLIIIACMINNVVTAQQRLTRAEAEATKTELIKTWKEELKEKLRTTNTFNCVVQGDLKMKYSAQVFGEKPADGRSLWISMHGGGNAPTSLNDSQWENQKRLYQPAEGVYVCPRAPWDDWDMWFKNPIDKMFEELIQTMMLYYDVNPDKVYLMGYSAGGDGVWRMAPRMADHWAAASMMAGHPGDVSLLGVRNLPFMLWCGGEDAAYNRNKEVALRGVEMDSLQRSDPEGYIHETHIVAGKPHWMDLEDKAALPWMAKYKRNPYPKTVVWCQGDNGRAQFYWLGVPAAETKKGNVMRASINNNVVTITKCDYSQVTIYLNDQLANLDKAVKVVYKKKTLFKGKIPRTAENLQKSLEERGDPSYCFPAILKVNIPR